MRGPSLTFNGSYSHLLPTMIVSSHMNQIDETPRLIPSILKRKRHTHFKKSSEPQASHTTTYLQENNSGKLNTITQCVFIHVGPENLTMDVATSANVV